MPKKSEIDKSKIKITHYMADGTVRDSIEGYVVPINENTMAFYHLLAQKAFDALERRNRDST